ncbi:MAG: LysR family transcriptional regulator [Pseudomonadota bacterium]
MAPSRDDTMEGRLTLRAMEVFAAVADAGSLSAGARRLGAAVSTVSQQLSGLEHALGVELIDRAARPFALTPAGRLFQTRSAQILDDIAKTRAALAALDLAAVRSLTLGLLEDLEGDVLPELLVRLSRTFPRCAFTVETGYSHRNIEALERRQADLVVASDVSDLPDGIERHRILRDPLILIAAEGVIDGDDILARLANTEMIRFNRAQPIARMIEAHLRRHRFAAPGRFEVETNHAMTAMVERTGGWAITTPLGLLSAEWAGRVEARPLPFQAQARTLYVCTRRCVLGTLPAAVSTVLRQILADGSVRRGRDLMPWLGDTFRVLDGEKVET